jgi:hypothetical protein
VSIAAETIGTFKLKFLENFEISFTPLGRISEYEGTRRTSSKVSPVSINLFSLIAINQN